MTQELQPTDSSLVREFVIAGHGNLTRVKGLLQAHPELLDMPYYWSESDHETGIMAAAQVGSIQVAEFLLSKGAPLSICTAAMLGRTMDVEKILNENPERIKERGAHGIPLLPHASLSGNLDLVKMLVQRGTNEGSSFALHNAVSRGYTDMARWLVENAAADVNWKNYQGKTALTIAEERKDEYLIDLLSAHGGHE